MASGGGEPGLVRRCQWDRTFRTNVYSFFWVTRAALEHMPDGGAIINSGSINGPYVFFASETLSSYNAGEVLAPIGGETLPG